MYRILYHIITLLSRYVSYCGKIYHCSPIYEFCLDLASIQKEVVELESDGDESVPESAADEDEDDTAASEPQPDTSKSRTKIKLVFRPKKGAKG